MGKVAWDYVVKVTMPEDLKGHKPGKLPEALLKPAAGGGKLHWRAANAWGAMVAKAKADGIELKPVSSGDTYRSYDSQLKVFLERYTKEPNGNSTRTFEGVKWYKKNEKLASLAAPGSSQHNLGIAVDVHTASGARLEWLIDNVKDFGFSWEVVPEEPWHLRYVAGDVVPAAVSAWIAAGNGYAKPDVTAAPAVEEKEDKPAPAPKPAAAPAAKAGDALDIGDSGPEVKALQEALKKQGFYPKNPDGKFDQATANAVKMLKGKHGLNAKESKAGAKVLEILGLKQVK